MNTLGKLALVLSVLPALTFATSLHPDTFTNDDVAKVVKPLNAQKIGREGKILRSRRQHPFSNFLIGIPAEVVTASACVDFVGTVSTVNNKTLDVKALGASDPVNETCIEIYPMPVKTLLTIEMNILTGGFVPAQRFQQQLVNINGAGQFIVTLDLHEERVTIKPVRPVLH